MKKRLNYLTMAVVTVVLPAAAGRAAIMYFDTNGATAGSTNSTTQQTWNSSATDWTTDSTGSIATVAYVDGSDAVFSAGSNAVSAYNVSTAGAKVANSITIEEGTVTFLPSTTAPTRTIGAGGITLAATANGNVTFNDLNGGDTLIVSASQAWTDNHATAGFVVSNANNKFKITGNAAASTTYTLTTAANGAGDMSLAAPISDGTAGGNLALAVASTGTGRVLLTGASTFTGGTSVSSGLLVLDNGGSLAHANISVTGGSLAGGTTGIGGTITDNIANDTGELISLSGSGVMDLTHLNLNVALTGTQTLGEYVLANADVGSANVTGTAFASATLPAGWSIAYSGTAANPGDIVLVAGAAPEPASLGLLGVGGVMLLARRRKA